jgi:hypothetical protein
MMVFISKVNNYMFRPKTEIFFIPITVLLKECHVYTDTYMTLFEQNCNCDNLKMAALGRNM